MDIPDELVEIVPFRSLPTPPTPSQSCQIWWWRAHCNSTSTRYWIENGHGKLLAESNDWAKLCAELGWFPGRKIVRVRPRHYQSSVKPAMCDDKLDEIIASGRPIVGLHKPKRPLEQRPKPPDEGEFVEICGYRVTRKTLRDKNGTRTYFYAYDTNDDVVSMAENWERWCHILNWFPLDDLEAGAAIPREEKPEIVRAPKPRSSPAVLNRHHYKSRDEIPEPWVYMGRGHTLGNPFIVVNDPDDPEIRSALAESPNEGRSSVDALTRFKRYLWDKIRRRDPAVLSALGKITAETNLVCSCAPRPCHLDVVVRAWKWARERTVLDGYDGDAPEWASDSHDSGVRSDASSPNTEANTAEPHAAPPPSTSFVQALEEARTTTTSAPAPASSRPQPQNLSLFGDT